MNHPQSSYNRDDNLFLINTATVHQYKNSLKRFVRTLSIEGFYLYLRWNILDFDYILVAPM